MRVIQLTDKNAKQKAYVNTQNIFLVRQGDGFSLVASAAGGAIQVLETAEDVAKKLGKIGLTVKQFFDIDRKVDAYIVVENTFVVRWSEAHKATHLISSANGFIGVAGTVEDALEELGAKQ